MRERRASSSGVHVFIAAAALWSCVARAPIGTPSVYGYALAPPPEGSWILEVEATLEGAPTGRLVAPESAMSLHDVVLVDRSGASPLARDGDAFLAPACRSRCTIRYTLDLDDLASSCRRMDCQRRVGDSIIGRASALLLRPEPMGDAMFHVRVVGPGAPRFATGLRREAGGFAFPSRALGEASFTAFGAMRQAALALSQARLDVVFVGPPLSMGDAAALEFIRESAECVTRLFHRFPVDATVFVVPVRGAGEVVFGRVMSLAGASVALLFGDATPASAARDNWVVVHELFHLGSPSFVGEGRWLEEGLATYYEPILRERAGWMTEVALWTHFVREMPRGLRRIGEPPDLEDRDDIDSTYWGGALFALLADVRSREATTGARSLDDAMRLVRDREGDATHTARLADFMRTADEATGTGEISGAYRSWAVRGEDVDLDALWARLGITGVEEARTQGAAVMLRDDAPLAAVRRAIAASPLH